jgi:hypothetical protein
MRVTGSLALNAQSAHITDEIDGGGRGIRTPERVTPLTVFKTAGFNHSPIPPFIIVSDFIRLRNLATLKIGGTGVIR